MFIKNKNISEDELLWSSFLSGNDEAYSLIYKKYSKKLFVQGLQFTSDKELIKDSIHDVFIKIYKNRKTFKSVDNPKVYLFVALRNSILSSLKKLIISYETFDQFSEEEYIQDNTIEDDIINKESNTHQTQFIDNILSQLTLRQREAIHYRFYENMSIDEIGVVMEMNYQSVQNLIQRSLKKISSILKKNKKK